MTTEPTPMFATPHLPVPTLDPKRAELCVRCGQPKTAWVHLVAQAIAQQIAERWPEDDPRR